MFKKGDVIYNSKSRVTVTVLDVNSKYYFVQRIRDSKIFEFHKEAIDHGENSLSLKHILSKL